MRNKHEIFVPDESGVECQHGVSGMRALRNATAMEYSSLLNHVTLTKTLNDALVPNIQSEQALPNGSLLLLPNAMTACVMSQLKVQRSCRPPTMTGTWCGTQSQSFGSVFLASGGGKQRRQLQMMAHDEALKQVFVRSQEQLQCSP